MKIRKDTGLAFIFGAVATGLISKLIADPVGDAILSISKTAPHAVAETIMNHFCAMLPYYEKHSLINLVGSIAIGFTGGIILYMMISEGKKNLPTYEDEFDETEDDQDENISEVTEALWTSLDILFTAFVKWVKKYFSIVFLWFVFCILNLSFIRSAVVTDIATETIRKIEIVSPYVSDLEYKQMKSDFYLIENWDDYDQLDKRIDSIMEAEGISLPNK